MQIRIISGKFGGRIIDGSNTDKTHPMSERMRNALFNIVGEEIKDATVLDAFAGSGSIGLEALSRGAKHVTFIEKDTIAQKIINKNIESLGVKNHTKLINASVSQYFSTTSGSFDIIFADPPYHDMQLSTVKKLFGLLKPNALMVLSYPDGSEVPTETTVVVVDNRSYGNAALAFYRRKDA